MINIVKSWIDRYFSDQEAVLLLFILIAGFSLVIYMGGILAPFLASLVIAYCLEWLVGAITPFMKRKYAVLLVFLGFLGVFFSCTLLFIPMLWKQLANLFNDIPSLVNKAQSSLHVLAEEFPHSISTEQIQVLTQGLGHDAKILGKQLITASIASIPNIVAWIVYLVLVPLMIFFFLYDSAKIQAWALSALPKDRKLLTKVFNEVNQQIGNYIRGKALEILIVGIVTCAVFLFFGLRYPVLLASLVGLSVLVPYVGAAVVSIPVALIGYLDYGLSPTLFWMLSSYAVIQALDGNVLVPLLFSEAVNLHPIAIVVSILVFGGIWGFWGIFFAIPLATLCKSVLYAWPTKGRASTRKPR